MKEISMTSVHRNDTKSKKPTLLNYGQKGSYTFTCEVMFFQKQNGCWNIFFTHV